MVKGIINSGICGFTINVEADSQDRQHVRLKINSDCPNYQKIAEELVEVDAFAELFRNPAHAGRVYESFVKHSPHPSCPGLSGILKTIEVAAGLALPKTATIEVIKED